MYLRKASVLLLISLLIITGSVIARDKVITKTFPVKGLVKVNTISGDLTIVQGNGDEILVEVVYNVRPRDAFEPNFKERKNSLRLSEDFHGYNSSGSVLWTITVPKNTRIDFNTASGDLTIEDFSGEVTSSMASGDCEIINFKGELELSTASGDYDISESSGILMLSTASGDVRIENCKGEIKASTASGNVRTSEIVLEEESSFSSASGNVYVELGESPMFDLRLSSASGNSTLNFNGNPIKGFFEFEAKERRGRISSPIDFDDEEIYRRRGDRDKYMRKTFTKGTDSPYISIKTASGRAVLKES